MTPAEERQLTEELIETYRSMPTDCLIQIFLTAVAGYEFYVRTMPERNVILGDSDQIAFSVMAAEVSSREEGIRFH